MHANIVLRCGIFSFLFFFILRAFAQYDITELDLNNDMRLWHDKMLGQQNTGLLVGEYEKFEKKSQDSHAFFEDDAWSNGRLKYRGEVYDSIPLIYDLYNDLLIIRHPTDLRFSSQPIRLIQDQISWFEIYGHFFRYYSESMGAFNPGFYDELYIGNSLQLLAKHRKSFGTESEQKLIYSPDDFFILKSEDQYQRIIRKGNILQFYKDQKSRKKKIRQFIRNSRLRLNSEEDLIQIIQYCDRMENISLEP